MAKKTESKRDKTARKHVAHDLVEVLPAQPEPVALYLRNNSSNSLLIVGHQRRIEIHGFSLTPVEELPAEELERLILEYSFLEVVTE